MRQAIAYTQHEAIAWWEGLVKRMRLRGPPNSCFSEDGTFENDTDWIYSALYGMNWGFIGQQEFESKRAAAASDHA